MKGQPIHLVKKHPFVGACGLPCGLCPRYHSGGEKPCPGCCGPGFWERHPSCPTITCCVKQHGLEVCGECNELEFCPRVLRNLEAAKRADSFISYRTLPFNLTEVKERGIKAAADSLQERIEFLRLLIREHDDGRSKGFYCLCVQLLPLDRLKSALAGAQQQMTTGLTPKEQTRLVREGFGKLADEMRVELRLRNGKAAKST